MHFSLLSKWLSLRCLIFLHDISVLVLFHSLLTIILHIVVLVYIYNIYIYRLLSIFHLSFIIVVIYRCHLRTGNRRGAISFQVCNAQSQFECVITSFRVAGVRRCHQYGWCLQIITIKYAEKINTPIPIPIPIPIPLSPLVPLTP